jgi:tetratricopeptide (TPR) repeat protein
MNSILELIEKADSYYRQRNYQEALLILNEVIESDSLQPRAYFLLANIFHLKGELGKALKAFNKVLELEPSNTEAAVSLSIIYNDIGKYEQAKQAFQDANENIRRDEFGVEDRHINKKLSFKHLELAEFYAVYSRLDEALHEYRKAFDLNPENLEIRIKIAKLYAQKGLNQKAFEELRKLKSEQPNYVPARMALGLMHYSGGDILEAQNEWQNILLKDPTNNEAKMYLKLSESSTETNLSF